MGTFIKGCLLVILILVVLGAAAIFFGYKYLVTKVPELTQLTQKAPTTITLTIDSGAVTKANQPLTTGSTINSGDTIKTASETDASLNYPSGHIVYLDENTEVTVKSESNLYTQLGRTWTRIKSLSGNQTFEIETPTAVATVRGTSFITTVSATGTSVDTDEGAVEVAAIETVAGKRQIIQTVTVDAGNFTQVNRQDISDLKSGIKKLSKQTSPPDRRSNPWLQKIKSRISTQKMELPNFTDFSTAELQKIRDLPNKIKSLTPDQIAQIESIGKKYSDASDPSQVDPADIAQILKIIDPENFSDTAKWTRLVQIYLKLAGTVDKPSTTNSDLFNSLQNLPAIGIPQLTPTR
jgi:hypothetical protein